MDLLKQEIKKLIQDTPNNKQDLLLLKSKVIGKNGLITNELGKIRLLDANQKIIFGKELNDVKQWFENWLELALSKLTNNNIEIFDTTVSTQAYIGYVHPLTFFKEKLHNIMSELGFSFEVGPSVESEYYNFDALNVHQTHPSRDEHDTFFLPNNILRTHTSCVQIRVLESHKYNTNESFRIYTIGDTYRRDDDVTHSPMFHQIEGLVVGKDYTFAHLKGFLYEFLALCLDIENIDQIHLQLRPTYFPFTEPSVEVDIRCYIENNILYFGEHPKAFWLEILGCGMVCKNILEKAGYYDVQGFAFGMGIERLAMIKYGVKNLNDFTKSSYNFLRQYGQSI